MRCRRTFSLIGALVIAGAAISIAAAGVLSDDAALVFGAVAMAGAAALTGASGGGRCCCATRVRSLRSRQTGPVAEDGNPYRDLAD